MSNIISYDDFARVKYNPFIVPLELPIWKFYPDFMKRADLHKVPKIFETESFMVEEKDLDRLLRFVVLFASNKNSPLANEANWDRRKEKIYELLHIGAGDPLRTKVIDPGHKWYNQVLGVFFRLIGEDDMEVWFSLKMQLSHSMTVMRSNPADAEDFSKTMALRVSIQKSLPDLQSSIKSIETKLFPSDDVKNAVWNDMVLDEDGAGGFAEYYAKDWI